VDHAHLDVNLLVNLVFLLPRRNVLKVLERLVRLPAPRAHAPNHLAYVEGVRVQPVIRGIGIQGPWFVGAGSWKALSPGLETSDFGVWNVRFWIWNLGLWGLECQISGLGHESLGLGHEISGLRPRILGF
jgi:hypothetical protein